MDIRNFGTDVQKEKIDKIEHLTDESFSPTLRDVEQAEAEVQSLRRQMQYNQTEMPQVELKEKIQELEDVIARIKNQFIIMEAHSGSSYDELAYAISKAWTELKHGINEVRNFS